MSEDQGKPKSKWYRNRIFIACAVIVIVGVSAAGAYWGTRSGDDGSRDGYDRTKAIVADAVMVYKSEHEGKLPTTNGTVDIGGKNYSIVNICVLLGKEIGTVWDVPAKLWSGNGSDNDNCDGGCTGCLNTSHYILAVDGNGSVYSTCVGANCSTHSTDGYQGVWP